MQPELIEAIKTVLLEATKIVGPACVAAYAAYKTASAQYKARIAEIEKQNQFKASEIMFNLYKQWFDGIGENYKSITENLAGFSGMLAGGSNGMDFTVKKLAKIYAHKIPFSLRKLERDFGPFKDKYPIEYEELSTAKRRYESLGDPVESDFEDYVVELEFIYSIMAACSQVIIAEKMDEHISQYTANK